MSIPFGVIFIIFRFRSMPEVQLWPFVPPDAVTIIKFKVKYRLLALGTKHGPFNIPFNCLCLHYLLLNRGEQLLLLVEAYPLESPIKYVVAANLPP